MSTRRNSHPSRPPCALIVARAVSWLVLFSLSQALAGSVEFNRQIRPILSENCLACHGPDPGARKAGLRLDSEEGLLGKERKGGPVVIPGDLEQSQLWQRIVTTDPDDIMPPPEAHKELSIADKELVRQWILEGAEWEPHWAFIPVVRPEVPAVPPGMDPAPVIRNPIDAFIAKRLTSVGLSMNPPADRRTLARRLALDLTGLPPTPEQVDAFVQDSDPDYYSRFVDQLMDTPQWGEHRARYWLDAARYADTHGLHFDNYREIWPYRDWVIQAFNQNQPFDQFVIEQLAGDLLPDPSQDQLVATGFHRSNMTTNEGGTIEEENLSIYATDRVSTTGWVFLGLTMNCAECHDHKFDPISQKDFYAMSAFFRNTVQPGLDGNVKDSRPTIVVVSDPEEKARWDVLPDEIERAKQAIESRKKAAQADFESWTEQAALTETKSLVDPNGLIVHASLNEGVGNTIQARLGKESPTAIQAPGDVKWVKDGKLGPAPEINEGSAFNLGDIANFERDTPFSYGAWVRVPSGGRYEAVLARMDQDQNYQGWDVFTHDRNLAVHIVHNWPENALKVVTTENPIEIGKWAHVWVQYDGSSKAAGIQIFVNGKPAKTKVETDTLTASIQTSVPLRVGQRSKNQRLNGGSVQDVRVYQRTLNPEEILGLATDAVSQALLAVAPDMRTEPQTEALFSHYLTQIDTAYQGRIQDLKSLEGERESIRQRNPVTHIQREKPDSKPMTPIKIRGQYNNPGEMVDADVPGALTPFPEDAPRNRLGLAQWIVAESNPLTARVTVNRFWQELFGVGLVETSEDFGIMGEHPMHQDLLDWLAADFQSTGWDVKRLFKLMVSSATYRQSQVVTEDKLAKDEDNRLLSRGPRFRMDGEMIRDYALSVSGLLVPKIGGPSVKPYQPDGVWEPVAMPESNTKRYQQDSGESLYRRSLYTFWKRAAPPASLEIFNAPSREVSCLRRERSNTPLQALTTLNDIQFLEAARHLATRGLRESNGDTQSLIDWLALKTLTRPLKPLEKTVVTDTFSKLIAHYDNIPTDAAELIHVGESSPPNDLPPGQLAAAMLIANQLLNLDEVLNK